VQASRLRWRLRLRSPLLDIENPGTSPPAWGQTSLLRKRNLGLGHNPFVPEAQRRQALHSFGNNLQIEFMRQIDHRLHYLPTGYGARRMLDEGFIYLSTTQYYSCNSMNFLGCGVVQRPPLKAVGVMRNGHHNEAICRTPRAMDCAAGTADTVISRWRWSRMRIWPSVEFFDTFSGIE